MLQEDSSLPKGENHLISMIFQKKSLKVGKKLIRNRGESLSVTWSEKMPSNRSPWMKEGRRN